MNTQKLAQEVAEFLHDYFDHDYYDDNDIKGTAEEVKRNLDDVSMIEDYIRDIEDVSDGFQNHKQYLNEAKPLIQKLSELKAQIEAEQSKRMVGDTNYEVKHAIHVGDKEIIFAVDMNADKGWYYLVCNATRNELFEQFTDGSASGDYLEMMKEFIGRLGVQIEAVRSEQEQINLPDTIFTAEHCFSNDYKQSIDGKVVAIRADVFRPEYRRGDNQLVLVAGGFGANANAHGSAVFCYHLNNGKHTRFERYDVQGEVKPECMSDWAKERLAAVKAQIAAEHAKTKKDRGDAR